MRRTLKNILATPLSSGKPGQEIGIRPMGSDTELDSEVSLRKLLAEFNSLRNASRHEINMLKDANSAFKALKEENSELKKKNKELEEILR